MADKTGIEWTDATWNPLRGCSRVSEGCKHCYAEGVAARFSGPGLPYEGLAKRVTRPDGSSEARWTGKVVFAGEGVLTQPFRWKRPRRIFVNSMSDLFHESVPDEWIDRIFAVMALAPQHTFQALTKRPERMRDYLGALRDGRRVYELACDMVVEGQLPVVLLAPGSEDPALRPSWPRVRLGRWPFPNVWLGVSVEDQPTADTRIPQLIETPAAVRFISAEPLLSSVDLSKWLYDGRREGILGAGGARAFQSGERRDDLALGEMDRRGARVGPDIRSEGESGAEHSRSGQLSSRDVQGRGETPEGKRPPDRLDGRQQTPDPAGDGDQSYRRSQAPQSSRQPRTGDAPAERATLAHASGPEEEGPAGREKLIGGGDGNAGARNPLNMASERTIPAGDSGEVQHHSIDGIGNRAPKELGPPSIDWVIVGGESGPGARPMHPGWARSLRDQCAAAGVAFLFKQHGEWAPLAANEYVLGEDTTILPDGRVREWQPDYPASRLTHPDMCRIYRAGKKAAGRLLDGVEHNGYPVVA